MPRDIVEPKKVKFIKIKTWIPDDAGIKIKSLVWLSLWDLNKKCSQQGIGEQKNDIKEFLKWLWNKSKVSNTTFTTSKFSHKIDLS